MVSLFAKSSAITKFSSIPTADILGPAFFSYSFFKDSTFLTAYTTMSSSKKDFQKI